MSEVIYKDRKHTNARKWDGCKAKFGKEDMLPFWIADMDFEVPKCVQNALREYVDFGVFGYYDPSQGYYDAFRKWEKDYHHYDVCREWMRFAPGVVPAINWLLHILTEENDAVAIFTPVYYPFHDAVVNNGRRLVECPLVRTDHTYDIDFEAFEKKIMQEDVRLCIFCSPHNPIGRVWRKEELQTLLEICKKHGVYVLSDEIHQDIIMEGYTQIPAASVGDYDDILITLTAATKTFNLAACQNSILIIPDERLRAMYDQYLVKLRISGGNAFGYIAVQSAYEGGREWFEEVLRIIEENYRYMRSTLEQHLPDVWIPDLQGTYLMWIDLSHYVGAHEIEHILNDECSLAVDYGTWFGGEEYDGCFRMNLATKPENIQVATERIIQALKR